MGKRNYSMHVALILGLAALVPQCLGKPPSWGPLPPPFKQTPALAPGQLPIDCKELAADPVIPAFLIEELCSPKLAEATADEAKDEEQAQDAGKEDREQAENTGKEDQKPAEDTGKEDQGKAEDTGKQHQEQAQDTGKEDQEQVKDTGKQDQEQPEDTGKEDQGQDEDTGKQDQEQAEDTEKEKAEGKKQPAAEPTVNSDTQDPTQVLVPFFRAVIEKLTNANGKLSGREFWVQAYQEAGAPKLSQHPSFFQLVASLQQAVESFRSEDSWWRVVRRLKDLTSDRQWKQLESALSAAHGEKPGNLWRALSASKVLKVALKSSIDEPECRAEGLNPDPEDCREFLMCFRFQGRWKSKDAKCPKHMEFSPSRRQCVWAPFSDCADRSDSDEDSDSDESGDSSREVLERIFKHGPAAFYVQ